MGKMENSDTFIIGAVILAIAAGNSYVGEKAGKEIIAECIETHLNLNNPQGTKTKFTKEQINSAIQMCLKK